MIAGSVADREGLDTDTGDLYSMLVVEAEPSGVGSLFKV